MDLDKAGRTHQLMGTGPGFAREEAAGQLFEQIWNRTKQFFWSELGPLVGYTDPSLTIIQSSPTICYPPVFL